MPHLSQSQADCANKQNNLGNKALLFPLWTRVGSVWLVELHCYFIVDILRFSKRESGQVVWILLIDFQLTNGVHVVKKLSYVVFPLCICLCIHVSVVSKVFFLLHTHTLTHHLNPADSAGWRWWFEAGGHVYGELTGVGCAAGWHHPQGTNDWVTSSHWLCRLQSRCIVDSFPTRRALYDYCTYFIQGTNSRPGSGKTDATEPNSVLHKTVISLQSESN